VKGEVEDGRRVEGGGGRSGRAVNIVAFWLRFLKDVE
jgi:hypothetical protein